MKVNINLVSIILLTALSLSPLSPAGLAYADNDPQSVIINFEVEGPDSTFFKSQVSVLPCATPNNATSTINGFCAFAAANLTVDASWLPFGGLINSIDGVAGDANNFWLWFLNGQPGQTSIDQYAPQPGDNVLWTITREPLEITASDTSPIVNATTTVTVARFNPTSFNFEPIAGATIIGASATTDSNGKVEIVATSTTPFTVSAIAPDSLPSRQITITPQPERVTLILRDGSATAFSGQVPLPGSDAPDILVSPTGSTTTVPVSPRSVLGLLESLQASSSSFAITDLSYSQTFNSFLVNCIAVPADAATPDCYNWTDAINGVYPQVGFDRQMLKNGDTVYLFFGSPHKTVLPKDSVAAGETFSAIAQQYDLSTGTYKPLPGVTLGVGSPNPDYSFTEIATSSTDSSGQAIFTLSQPGNFSVGIKEDFYFPAFPITVTNAPTTLSSGGSGGISHVHLNVPNALTFMSNSQNADGSFGSPLVTDWAAIALASANPTAAKTKLQTFLQNDSPVMDSITDYERRSMALQALGINPYSGTHTDYVTPIIKAFDGTQIGIPSDNDDIFALLVLQHAGYGPDDDLIQKEVNFVLSSQRPDGSWDGIPDLTAAAVQALQPLAGINGVTDGLNRAARYLSQTELADGSWGNPDSTSWVQTAINRMIEAQMPGFGNENNWLTPSGNLPTDFLAKTQQPDGGVTATDNLLSRVWSTSYAITAASGKSWVTLLRTFPKPSTALGGNISQTQTAASTITATTTAQAAPSSLAATSTPVAEDFTATFPQSQSSNAEAAKNKVQAMSKKRKIVAAPKSSEPQPSNTEIPKVLGQSITQVPVLAPQNTAPVSASRKGFMQKFWGAITSFFSRIF